MKYRIVNDKIEGLRLEVSESYELLATFFTADLQQDPLLCRYYLERVTKVLSGDAYHTDLTGNAHTVTVTVTTTTITSLFDDTVDPVEIDTLLFKELLIQWCDTLAKKQPIPKSRSFIH